MALTEKEKATATEVNATTVENKEPEIKLMAVDFNYVIGETVSENYRLVTPAKDPADCLEKFEACLKADDKDFISVVLLKTSDEGIKLGNVALINRKLLNSADKINVTQIGLVNLNKEAKEENKVNK